MNRKELYLEIKQLGIANYISEKAQESYTRLPNIVLEEAIKDYKKNVILKKSKNTTVNTNTNISASEEKSAIIKLLSILQSKRVITAVEAEQVAKMF